MNSALAEVLNEALMDEYKARDTYQIIIDTFGPVRPFINIVEAEQTHIEFLLPLYEKYGIPLPPEPDPERITAPNSLLQACEIGVEAEIENVAMYDRLIKATDLLDVVAVLQRLQAASRDHHMPAFQLCVERGGSPAEEEQVADAVMLLARAGVREQGSVAGDRVAGNAFPSRC